MEWAQESIKFSEKERDFCEKKLKRRGNNLKIHRRNSLCKSFFTCKKSTAKRFPNSLVKILTQKYPITLSSAYIYQELNAPTPDRPFVYSEIVTHTTLELMTKLTEYPSPAKQEAKIEAQRRNAEMRVLKKSQS